MDQGQNKTEQDTMIEHYNRIDVHDLDKWLDAGKSRLSNNKKEPNSFIILKKLMKLLSVGQLMTKIPKNIT